MYSSLPVKNKDRAEHTKSYRNQYQNMSVKQSCTLPAMNRQEQKRIMMQECVEDELGYPAPSNEKPYNAYEKTQEWESWEDVPENWKKSQKSGKNSTGIFVRNNTLMKCLS